MFEALAKRYYAVILALRRLNKAAVTIPLKIPGKPYMKNNARMSEALDQLGVSGRVAAPKAMVNAPATLPIAMQYRVDFAECRNNPAARPVANAGTAPNKYENKANASAPGTAKTRSVPLPDQMAATTAAHPKGIEPIGGAMTPKNKAPLNALLIEKVNLDHLLGDIGAVSMRFPVEVQGCRKSAIGRLRPFG